MKGYVQVTIIIIIIKFKFLGKWLKEPGIP